MNKSCVLQLVFHEMIMVFVLKCMLNEMKFMRCGIFWFMYILNTGFRFTYSKWNMGEIFGLNFHLSYLHTPQFFFWNSSMRKNGNFCYWISPLLAQVKCANLPNESNLKRNNFCTIRFLVLIYSYKAMLPIFPSKNMLKVSVNKQKLSGNWKSS